MAKKRMKLTRLLVIICIFIFLMASGSLKAAEKNKDEGINLEGQWKVTDYLTSRDVIVEYDYYEHFLGRSIVIKPNRIIKSFGCWDDLLNDVVSQYRAVEVETVNGGTYGRKPGEEWQNRYGDQDVTVVTYDMPESMEWRYMAAAANGWTALEQTVILL